MQENLLKISLNQNSDQNYVELSSTGGRIFKLVLGGIIVI